MIKESMRLAILTILSFLCGAIICFGVLFFTDRINMQSVGSRDETIEKINNEEEIQLLQSRIEELQKQVEGWKKQEKINQNVKEGAVELAKQIQGSYHAGKGEFFVNISAPGIVEVYEVEEYLSDGMNIYEGIGITVMRINLTYEVEEDIITYDLLEGRQPVDYSYFCDPPMNWNEICQSYCDQYIKTIK